MAVQEPLVELLVEEVSNTLRAFLLTIIYSLFNFPTLIFILIHTA